jgi:predicted dehydrogenase
MSEKSKSFSILLASFLACRNRENVLSKMSKRVKIAILGAGRIAEVHMQGYNRVRDRVNVCALIDARKEVAQAKAAEWGVGKSFQTLDEFLNHESCDAVDICLPPNVHLECVQKACAAMARN